MRICGPAVVGAVLASASMALGDTATLPAARDNTIYSEGQLSNGQGPHLFSGLTAAGNDRRALIMFDASSIPVGSVVTSVTLKMFMSRTIALDGPSSLHRALRPWGEGASNAGSPGGAGAPAMPGDCTWTHAFVGATPWAIPGGDFDPLASGVTMIGLTAGTYIWSDPGMVVDVQQWVDAPATNFGWFILSSSPDPFSARRFDSRENLDPGRRPSLVVEYTPPGSGCVADVDDGSGLGVPDGSVDIADLLYYLNIFDLGMPQADLDDGSGTGTPDLAIDISDLLYYLGQFDAGCP